MSICIINNIGIIAFKFEENDEKPKILVIHLGNRWKQADVIR